MAEIPEGLAIEQVWAIDASFVPGWEQRRSAVRAEHLARIAQLRAEGVIIEAGAFVDEPGSVLLVRAPDEQSALAVVREDVYLRAGVWGEFRARRFGRAIRTDELPGR